MAEIISIDRGHHLHHGCVQEHTENGVIGLEVFLVARTASSPTPLAVSRNHCPGSHSRAKAAAPVCGLPGAAVPMGNTLWGECRTAIWVTCSLTRHIPWKLGPSVLGPLVLLSQDNILCVLRCPESWVDAWARAGGREDESSCDQSSGRLTGHSEE